MNVNHLETVEHNQRQDDDEEEEEELKRRQRNAQIIDMRRNCNSNVCRRLLSADASSYHSHMERYEYLSI
ncbi:hypothetical protein BLOT_015364 [Blomia tropicalis]|nr:hypothetical protein BLOT_015364 [Blomia tropicalis]